MGAREAAVRSASAMRSPVNWALLGLVIQRPSYGYELIQRFERTYGDSLELSSPSQIYTALDSLVHRELIEEQPLPAGEETGRQPKPHYRATRHGIDSYLAWLVSLLKDERRRSRLFAQQIAVLDPEIALEVLEQCEQACLQEASSLPPGSAGGTGAGAYDGGVGAAGLVDRLTNEEDRLRVHSRLSWTDYARRLLRAQIERRAAP